MNTDNKVSTEPSQHKVATPPTDPASTPDVSPAINGEAQDRQRPQTKEPAEKKIITNQMYEPKLITDQEQEGKEPPKSE